VLIILNSLGIAITPLLTALGVGGLAIALALKIRWQTYFPASRSSPRASCGRDYVKLESGFERRSSRTSFKRAAT
jgi:hypothetical protein